MTVSVPARGRRHHIGAVLRARELHQAGWEPPAIVALLAQEGVNVARSTVHVWIDRHDQAVAHRKQQRTAARLSTTRGAAGGLISHNARPEFIAARIRALHNLGVELTDAQVAAVIAFDLPGRVVGVVDVQHALEGWDACCSVCGGPLPPYSGMGRRRKRCESCSPSRRGGARGR